MERPGEDTRWRDQGRTLDEETRGGQEMKRPREDTR